MAVRWTTTTADLVRKLAAKRKTASQIALVIGKTRNSVIGYCYRNHIPLRGYVKLTEVQVKDMIRRRQRGEMLNSIANSYGIYGTYVCSIMHGRIRAWAHLLTDKKDAA